MNFNLNLSKNLSKGPEIAQILGSDKILFTIKQNMNMGLIPLRSGDSKIDPTVAITYPLENTAVGDAGVGSTAAGIEGEALRPEGSGEVDYLGCVEIVVGPR